MKRDRKILVCMNDAEYASLNRLVETYSEHGVVATKSFLVRYGLKLIPHQQHLPLSDFGLVSKSAC